MINWAESILLALSLALGVSQIPAPSHDWQITTPWTRLGSGAYQFVSKSETVGNYCQENPRSHLNFPLIIHSATQVFNNGVLVARQGDPSFERASDFFGGMSVSCDLLQGVDNEVTWKAYSYSSYFARFFTYPFFTAKKSATVLFYKTLPSIGAGALLLLSLLNILIFYRKIPNSKLWSLVMSNLLTSTYFMGSVISEFGFNISMLSAHRLADIGLWSGFLFFVNLLYLEGLIPKMANIIVQLACLAAIVFIFLAQSGNMIQFGTTVPFIPVLGVTSFAFYNLMKARLKTRKSQLQTLSLGFFLLACFNDVFLTLGFFSHMPLLPLGMMGSYSFILFSVNEEILKTYTQRDEFKRLTDELRVSNIELKKAQAMVVHKSKLEALGTLAAGIAHEINNPLNHVYSFLKPLGKMCADLDEAKKKKSAVALKAMKECLEMTFSIINSLKNYSGLNHAEISEIKLQESVKSILVILKNKLNGVRVQVDVPDELVAVGNSVSINQVLMNLVTNARDAIEKTPEGKISIRGHEDRGSVILEVEDNGKGIEAEDAARIFDPFFTTKEIGKGMGLGLHICQSELQKYGGRISLKGNTQQGSCFIVCIPRTFEHEARS